MKLIKYALLLMILVFGFISVCGAAYTYEGYPHNNVFAMCGECFTLKVTTTEANGQYMTFYWAKANNKIIIDNSGDYIEVTIDELGNRVYYSTEICIPGYDPKLDPEGEWFVKIVEYDADKVEIGTDKNNFHVECDDPGSEFTLGSFIVLLSVGGLYLVIRRKGRFF